jgi:hypothetical protein
VELFEIKNCSAWLMCCSAQLVFVFTIRLEAVEKPADGECKAKISIEKYAAFGHCAASAAIGAAVSSSHLSLSEQATQNYLSSLISTCVCAFRLICCLISSL